MSVAQTSILGRGPGAGQPAGVVRRGDHHHGGTGKGGGGVKIGLIDVDGHRYPNLAIMKLAAWHKARGDKVE